MQRPPIKLTIASLMIAIAAIAVVLAFWKAVIVFGLPILAIVAYVFGCRSERRLDYAVWACALNPVLASFGLFASLIVGLWLPFEWPSSLLVTLAIVWAKIGLAGYFLASALLVPSTFVLMIVVLHRPDGGIRHNRSRPILLFIVTPLMYILVWYTLLFYLGTLI
jgi:hypothetical protein